ncbi:MAG: site-specific DNA-methyltransferase [Candidatus Pacebacteria bacterium]|nr:site-specific DNA-methyltransferase [Candidatus Paceibacterota bacterium]
MSIHKNEIYQLGPHLLACGDALNPEIVNRLIGKKKIPLVLSDMPYAIGLVENKVGFNQTGNRKRIINDHLQSDEEYMVFTKKWLELVKPHLADKNSFYLFNSDKMIFAMREAIIKAGFKFSQLLIWVKNHSVLGRMDYLVQHELIAYGWYGTHKFQKSQDKTVLLCPKPNKSPLHPTMKPVSLLRRLILNSSKISDWVYDPFAGSGSLVIACEQTRRKALLIEIDPDYCQTTINRFEKFTGIKAKKL